MKYVYWLMALAGFGLSYGYWRYESNVFIAVMWLISGGCYLASAVLCER